MGLFGGSKRSTTHNDNRVINDGEFAGNTGSVVANDGDYVGGDNIRYDGEYAGNRGTINLTDGGAVKEALLSSRRASEYALDKGEEVTSNALDGMRRNAEGAMGFAESALKDYGSTLGDFAEELGKSSRAAMLENRTVSETALKNNRENMTAFTDSINEVVNKASGAVSHMFTSQTSMNGRTLDTISRLGETSATGGQSVIANSAKNIAYVALGLAGVVIAIGMTKGG
ncbi:hypothetical protein [Algicola sagamiensis]|uniref:hypothetical protein n=1 Tax=Algicola sagamiensis TaxID=163869 RepID=UPI000372855B|nr:hypothetical protein [Algicola sagamiensis]